VAASSSRKRRQAVNDSSRSAAGEAPAPDQRGQALAQPLPVRPAPRDHLGQLGRRLVGGVGLQDPGVGLDDLAQRPEGHPLAVGQAAALAPGDQVGGLVEPPAELGHQAALADPGLAGD